MKKILLIVLAVLCLVLTSCLEVPSDETGTDATKTTETAKATETTETTEATTTTERETTTSFKFAETATESTTEYTTATTTVTTQTTEPPVPPTEETFIEFDSNGRPILSSDDKNCFELVTRTVSIDDVKALAAGEYSLKEFCEVLPLQCIRKFSYGDDDADIEEIFYVVAKTDEGWYIISFVGYPSGTDRIVYSHVQKFIVEDADKKSMDFIRKLNKTTDYRDLCNLGYKGTITFDGANGQFSGRGGLEVLYVFGDGVAVHVTFTGVTLYTVSQY